MTVSDSARSTDAHDAVRGDAPPAPPSRLRLRAAAVATAFLLNGLMFGAWAARIPAVQAQTGIDKAGLGFALLAPGIGAVMTMSVGAWLGGRFGTHLMVAATLVCCGLLEPIIMSSTNFAMLAGSLFFFGIAQGSMDVCMNANGLAVERAGMGPIMSRLHGAWSVGSFLGAMLSAGLVALGVGLLPEFLAIGAALAIAGVVLGRVMLPDRHTGSGSGFRRPPRRIWAIGALAFCGLVAEGSASDWSAVYVRDSLQAAEWVASLAVAAFAFSMASARLAGDRLTLVLGPARLVVGGAALAAVGLSLTLGVPWAPAAIAGFAMMGAGLAAIVPVMFRAGGSQPGVPSATGIAAVSTMGYAGSLLGPPVIGTVASVTSLRFALVIVLGMLAALMLGGGRVLASAPARAKATVTESRT